MDSNQVSRWNHDVPTSDARTYALLSYARHGTINQARGRLSDSSEAPSSEDLELLEAWRTGQNAAGQLLLERHSSELRCFFRRHAGDLADDLLQETLMVGVRQRDRFRGGSSFRTYLFGIAKKLLYRAQQRKRRLPDIFPLEDVETFNLGIEPDLNSYQFLSAALSKLRRHERLMVRQYFWEERTGTEIGQTLGVSERAIRSRLRRALARLRVVLKEMDHGERRSQPRSASRRRSES